MCLFLQMMTNPYGRGDLCAVAFPIRAAMSVSLLRVSYKSKYGLSCFITYTGAIDSRF